MSPERKKEESEKERENNAIYSGHLRVCLQNESREKRNVIKAISHFMDFCILKYTGERELIH